MSGCGTCTELLSEGLDLCVRARNLDAQDRSAAVLSVSKDGKAWKESGRFDKYVAEHNTHHPESPLSTRCGMPQLWLLDQYDRDLHDWEIRSRQHLMQGCKSFSQPQPKE